MVVLMLGTGYNSLVEEFRQGNILPNCQILCSDGRNFYFDDHGGFRDDHSEELIEEHCLPDLRDIAWTAVMSV